MSSEDLSVEQLKIGAADFLEKNAKLVHETKNAWRCIFADSSDKEIIELLKQSSFIVTNFPLRLSNLIDARIAFYLILKEILGIDSSTIARINKIKETLDKKSDDEFPLRQLLLQPLLNIKEDIIDDENKAETLQIEITNHMEKMEEYLNERANYVSEESEMQRVMEYTKKCNSDFVNKIKTQLKKASDADDNKIDKECSKIFESLQIKVTQPFIRKAIDNISKNGDRLASEGETQKADLNKKLVLRLREKSDDFYNQTEFKSAEAKAFFEDFSNKIKKHEKPLDIPRNIWKPILGNIGLALTGVGLLAVIGKAAHGAYDFYVNKNNNASFYFFGNTKSKEREVVKTVSTAFSPSRAA